MTDFLPCPFCGGSANFERMGNPRQSCIVVCDDCGCRLETNESWTNSGKQWNTRTAHPESLAGCLHPGKFGCQHYGKCLSVSCDRYGKTEYRPRMTLEAQDPNVLYPKVES